MSRRLTLLVLANTIFLAASRVATGQATVSGEAKALAVYAPRPAYPYEAREKHLTGSGIVLLNVDSSTGTVVSAQMLKSTGYKVLDDSALEAFRQWRFKPGTVRKVRIPTNFVMRGSPGYGEYLRAVGHSLWLQNATDWSFPEYPREARDKGCAVSKKVGGQHVLDDGVFDPYAEEYQIIAPIAGG